MQAIPDNSLRSLAHSPDSVMTPGEQLTISAHGSGSGGPCPVSDFRNIRSGESGVRRRLERRRLGPRSEQPVSSQSPAPGEAGPGEGDVTESVSVRTGVSTIRDSETVTARVETRV